MGKNENKTNELFDSYQLMSKVMKMILQMSSVIYEGVTKTTLINCVKSFQFYHEDLMKSEEIYDTEVNFSFKDVIAPKEIPGFIEKLVEKGLLIVENGYRCNDLLVDQVTVMAKYSDSLNEMLRIARRELPLINKYTGKPEKYERCLREARAAVYNENFEEFDKYCELTYNTFKDYKGHEILNTIFKNLNCSEWFKNLPEQFKQIGIDAIFASTIYYLESPKDISSALRVYDEEQTTGLYFTNHRVLLYILQGRFSDAIKLVNKGKDMVSLLEYQGWVDFLTGNNKDAILKCEGVLELLKSTTKNMDEYFHSMVGVFFLLALIKSDDVNCYRRILNIVVHIDKENTDYISYDCLKALVFIRENKLEEAKEILLVYSKSKKMHCIDLIIYSFVTIGTFPELVCCLKKMVENSYIKAVENKYEWVAMELAGILAKLEPDDIKYSDVAKEIQNRINSESILTIIKDTNPWERSLNALQALDFNVATNGKVENYSGSRLIWLVSEKGYKFTPREQSLTGNGEWNKGRLVSLERLMGRKMKCMTPHDHEIAKATERKLGGKDKNDKSDVSYGFNRDKMILAMVGHPLIFLETSPSVAVEFIKVEPELLVERKEGCFEMKISVDFQEPGVYVLEETPTRFKVVEVNDAHKKIKDVIGNAGLSVPNEGENQVLDTIKHLVSVVTVNSDVDGVTDDIPMVKANTKICVHLLPVGDGIRFGMFVRPFEDVGPYYKPGAGGRSVYAEIKGKRTQTRRVLKEEMDEAFKVIDACPALATINSPEEELFFEKSEECLQLLLELKELEDQINIEWPEGGKLKIGSTVSFDKLKLSIGKKNDWFGVSGELFVDEKLTLSLMEVFRLVQKSKTNFVKLQDGTFLSLTNEFKKRLGELAAYTEKSVDGCKFHALASLAVKDLVDNVENVEVDAGWNEQMDSLQNIKNFEPKIPTTLQTELREYQVEGYNWLARLAYWGVGACLADDMGLGKTLQALALILDRTKNGPTLVVAPASVCPNWVNEAKRFAPTLNVMFFNNIDRKKTLSSLKGFDLLVSSYGLLKSEIDNLEMVNWHTIVLDEAQVIKNSNTQASHAAMRLESDFKMLTTGTPIENHLGELWNLFRFITPGLLGSMNRFNETFAIPIEKYENVEVKKRLKTLIQPFILRRTKSQVLEELPPKTEITLSVELTLEEASFYEALRKQTLSDLDFEIQLGNTIPMKILAAIMKLRRACCHSRLVLPESKIVSSKLMLFAEIVTELKENKHKALVFSQFVDHLDIIRKKVERMGLSYQYLDGRTPIKKRKELVDAFQSGEGDLFLISLKAGGVGLNLTAADYVLHMDPWWNPAVEDQASDRAHRIGQQRPVTIYRFVTKNTIEEKIVALHSAKRNLADSLLDGTETVGKISAEQLLGLIREG